MAKPNIGISMLYCLAEPFNKMVAHIPETGSSLIELVDEGSHALNKNRAIILKELASSYSLKYTVHAPFAGVNIALSNGVLLKASLKRLKTSVINASLLESELWIYHPGLKTGISMFYPGIDWKNNIESVRYINRIASEIGQKVAIENGLNMFILSTIEDFRKFFEEIDENVCLVLDTGHANLLGRVEAFLTEFSNEIVHLHVHDNNGKIDEHLGVAYGNINWHRVLSLLNKMRFDGSIIIEAVTHWKETREKLEQSLTYL